MFEDGNKVTVGGAPLKYTDNCALVRVPNTWETSHLMDFVPDGVSTMLFPQFSLGSALYIKGSLGSTQTYGPRTTGSYNYKGWKGFWRQTHPANAPSVTHLYVTSISAASAEPMGNWDTSPEGQTSEYDWFWFGSPSNLKESVMMMYFLWAVPSGAQTSESQFQSVVRAAVDAVVSPMTACSEISSAINSVSGLSFLDIDELKLVGTIMPQSISNIGNRVSINNHVLPYGTDCKRMDGEVSYGRASDGQVYSMDVVSNGISLMTFDQIHGSIAVTDHNDRTIGSTGSYNYNGWRGFWQQTHSTTAPSVTHLWITNSASAVAAPPTGIHGYGTPKDGLHNIGRGSVMYMLWGVPNGAQTSDAQFQAVIQAAVNAL